MKLHAAPSDVEEEPDEEIVEDPAEEIVEDPAEDPKEAKRRAIEERAAERRAENERIARETAATTVRETTRATADAAARAEADRVEREALAAMTDDQRTTYALAKQVKNTQDGMSQVRVLTQSTTDSSKFDRLLTRKPQYEKYADEVEARHQNTLNQGAFVPREAILAHLIGERAMKADAVTKQKDAAGRRVTQARGNSGRAARGDSTGRNTAGKSIVQKAEEADWAI